MPSRARVDDPYDLAVAAHFRARRGELRLSMKALAEQTRIHPNQLSRLFNETAHFGIGELVAIALALSERPSEVLDDIEASVGMAAISRREGPGGTLPA